jgi:ketosteroid isomerase-like protein
MSAMTLERVAQFGDVWRRGDVNTLRSYIADDCEFRVSVGHERGSSFIGREAVRRGFELMLAYDAGAEGHGGHTFVDGDVGASQWSFGYEQPDGSTVEVRGCDICEFAGDRIRVKDAYRKVAGAIDRAA